MLFQNRACILLEQLIYGDELTGVDQLIRQYRVRWHGYEVRQLLARRDCELQLLSVLIVSGRIPRIFVLHAQRFEHPTVMYVVLFGIAMSVFFGISTELNSMGGSYFPLANAASASAEPTAAGVSLEPLSLADCHCYRMQ